MFPPRLCNYRTVVAEFGRLDLTFLARFKKTQDNNNMITIKCPSVGEDTGCLAPGK